MSALGSIQESLSSLASQKSGGGMGMQDMMMFMIALNSGGGSQAPAAAQPAQPKAWNYDNGTWTPTY
jgi:hypothetical protein